MPVNIFDIPKVVNIVVPETTGGSGVIYNNYPLNRTDFTLVQGVSQTIQFFVRDIDRQVAPLPGSMLTLVITDARGETVLLTRTMTLTDATQGLFAAAFVPADLMTLTLGAKRYSVVATDLNGVETMLWMDQAYMPYSYVNVVAGPFPAAAQPITLPLSNFVINDGWAQSSPYAPTTGLPDAVTTLVVYSNTFSGIVKLQGSLEAIPGDDPTAWFDILAQTFNTVTGNTAMSATGSYQWVRVVYTIMELQSPSLPPFPTTSGTVTQMLLKV